jgi:aldehyde dehydrogenase (NAD+)
MPVKDAALELLPDCRGIVGGVRVDGASGGAHEHVYAATGRPTATVPLGGAAEVDAAVDAARAAAGRWRRLPAGERRAALLRLAERVAGDRERLAGLQTLESGMPTRFARAIPGAAADFLAYYAGWTDKLGGEVVETWPV